MVILGDNLGGRTQNVFVLERNPKTTWGQAGGSYGDMSTDGYYTQVAIAVNFSTNSVLGMFRSGGWQFTQTLVGVYGR